MAEPRQYNNLPHWSTHRVKCTGCIPRPSWLPGLLKEDDDSCPRVKTAPNNQTDRQVITQSKQFKNSIISVRLTKSISGLVLKAWKSSSFIDTNMLASMPREVPMPYKIYRHAEQWFLLCVNWDVHVYKIINAMTIVWLCLYLFIRLRKCVVANQRGPN